MPIFWAAGQYRCGEVQNTVESSRIVAGEGSSIIRHTRFGRVVSRYLTVPHVVFEAPLWLKGSTCKSSQIVGISFSPDEFHPFYMCAYSQTTTTAPARHTCFQTPLWLKGSRSKLSPIVSYSKVYSTRFDIRGIARGNTSTCVKLPRIRSCVLHQQSG